MDIPMVIKVAFSLLGILLAAHVIVLIITLVSTKGDNWCVKDLGAGDCELYEQDDQCYCIDKISHHQANIDSFETFQECCHKQNGSLATASTDHLLKWLAKRLYLMGVDDGLVGLRKIGSVWYWMGPEGAIEADDLLWRDDVEQDPTHTYASIDVRSIIVKIDDYEYKIYNYDFYIDYDAEYQWFGFVTTNLTNEDQRFYICQYARKDALKNIVEDKYMTDADHGFAPEAEPEHPEMVTTEVPVDDLTVPVQGTCQCSESELIELFAVDRSKTIISPGYPRGYCDNQNCGWLVKVQGDLAVRLEWIAFNTENKMDFLFIYDSETVDHSKLIASCTGISCTNQVSSGKYLYMNFISDHVTRDIGFKALVRAVPADACYCPESQMIALGSTEEDYSFSSPDFLNRNCEKLNCKWLIKGVNGYGLQIVWNQFSLRPSSFVSLSEGDILKKNCTGVKCNIVITDGPELEIHYKTGSRSASKVGFSALVKVVQNYCDKNDLNVNRSVTYTMERDSDRIAVGGTAAITCPENHKINHSLEDVADSVICTSPHWSRQLGECIPVCQLNFMTVTENTDVVSMCNFGDIEPTSKLPVGRTMTVEQYGGWLTEHEHLSTIRYSCTDGGWLPEEPPTCTKITQAILLIGGCSDIWTYAESDLLILYLPGKNSTQLSFKMPDARTGHASVVMSDGNVMVTGGKSNDEPLSSSYTINVNFGSITIAPNTISNRYLSASTQFEGVVCICAGYAGENCETYNGTEWTTNTARLSSARDRSQMVALNGSLYIIGGTTRADGIAVNTVEKYSTESGNWQLVESMQQRRKDFGAAVLNGIIYACGGTVEPGGILESESLGSCESYENMVWKSIAHMNIKRHSFQLVAFDGKLYALGGIESILYTPPSQEYTQVQTQLLKSVETYDPISNQWTTEELELAIPIGQHTAVVLSVTEGIELGF